jgi:hypothetical protein
MYFPHQQFDVVTLIVNGPSHKVDQYDDQALSALVIQLLGAVPAQVYSKDQPQHHIKLSC